LHKLIPTNVNTFAKLNHGKPYQFDRWDRDRNGSVCLYYRFEGSHGGKIYTKRLLASEILTALRHLRDTGTLNRKAFERICPCSASAGPCGFAVLGRIFEALGLVHYAGREGFELTNAVRATSLLSNR
jgi:hypothetical protein